MRKPSRQFVFQRVYDMAAMVEECIENEGSLIELDWENPELLRGLAKFSKISILHRYVYAIIAVEHRYEYRKNADMYEAEDVGDIERLFDAYGINYLSYGAFTSPIPIEEARSREEDPFYH